MPDPAKSGLSVWLRRGEEGGELFNQRSGEVSRQGTLGREELEARHRIGGTSILYRPLRQLELVWESLALTARASRSQDDGSRLDDSGRDSGAGSAGQCGW
jgi:hypothetical protein